MNLHKNKELLREAIKIAAQTIGIREIYVEKDYWVTVALYEIFHSKIADQVVFKGGTALAKCYKLIDRFSEDVDLVVLRNENETDNQMKKKIRGISQIVGRVMPEIEIKGLTNKKGNIRKTAHAYEKEFQGSLGQVREHIILETSWLGGPNPNSKQQISCYLTEMMLEQRQNQLIEQYNMSPFYVQVLCKTRTFCEKIMSLVRFSRTNQPIRDLRNKIRHVYDLHQMLKDSDIDIFFGSQDFDEMLLKVGNDDMHAYKNNNSWLAEHPAKAMIFAKTDPIWKDLRGTYNSTFKELITGQFPSDEEIVSTLKTIEQRLLLIKWSLNSA